LAAFTVIESCRRRKLNPYDYLKDVLSRLPRMTNKQIPEVTPEAWGKKQREKEREARRAAITATS
jgi:hypothetical protein